MSVAMAESPRSAAASNRVIAAYLAVLALARERGYVVTRLKMAKLLYLADLAAVRGGEEPISGVEWRWLNHGPFNHSLQFLENDLVDQGIVRVDRYYNGFQVRLIGELPASSLQAEELAILQRVVAKFGGLAASSLKDLSYQTAPMVDAQERGQGVVLDLSLARPKPRLGPLTRRMSAILDRLPQQETDPEVFDEIAQEMSDLGPARRRATEAALEDDR